MCILCSIFFAKIQNFYCQTDHTNTTPTSILPFGGKSYFSQQHILTILTSCASNKKSATKKLFYYVRSGFGSKAKSIILSSANGNRHVVYKVKIYTYYNILHSLGLKSFDMFFNADLLQFDRSIDRWIGL